MDPLNDNELSQTEREFYDRRGDDDSFDEELLAMAGPPPTLRHGLLMVGVIALAIGLLTWFYPELNYLLQGFNDPRDLGDAAGIEIDTLENNTFVKVEGIPWITKSIDFNDGRRWFPNADDSRRLFPLSGQTKLLVQWTQPDEQKKYRDPRVNPSEHPWPSNFKGQLLRISELDRNYAKLWSFLETRLNLPVTHDTWLLIDGQLPGDHIWVIPIYIILCTIIIINLLKLRRFWIVWRS